MQHHVMNERGRAEIDVGRPSKCRLIPTFGVPDEGEHKGTPHYFHIECNKEFLI